MRRVLLALGLALLVCAPALATGARVIEGSYVAGTPRTPAPAATDCSRLPGADAALDTCIALLPGESLAILEMDDAVFPATGAWVAFVKPDGAAWNGLVCIREGGFHLPIQAGATHLAFRPDPAGAALCAITLRASGATTGTFTVTLT